MKYKCLVLDHDDTVVDSTAKIHFPAFIEYIKVRRPHLKGSYTLEDYLRKNFHPGIMYILTEELGLNEREIKEEEGFWADFVEKITPPAFEGISEIISEFRARGGIIAVSSHSLTRYIERDYRKNSLPLPDRIFGWDIPKEERKPAPHTLFHLMRDYKLSPDEILVVDDLKPGYDMARAAGAHFAAAGWAYSVPEIESFMKQNCDYYLKTLSELRKVLFG